MQGNKLFIENLNIDTFFYKNLKFEFEFEF